MKNNLTKQELDHFSNQLIRNFAAVNQEEAEHISPFFLARLRSRIKHEEAQATQFWEMGIIKAQRWLVAFSFVALLFFFGNLIAIGTQFQVSPFASASYSSYFSGDLEENDDLHSAEEALSMDEFQKE